MLDTSIHNGEIDIVFTYDHNAIIYFISFEITKTVVATKGESRVRIH